jgi:hypothetical protein
MIIAFDYGGVLEVNPTLRELGKSLLVANEVHIISAVHPKDEARIRADIESWGIEWSGVHFVHFTKKPVPQVAYEVGKKKARVMEQIGASMLFDDNPHICRALKDEGLISLLVSF